MMNSYILNAECAFIRAYGLIKLNAIKKILGWCLLISNLPDKALRMLVDISRLAERFNMHF